jgi:hypothetical protein
VVLGRLGDEEPVRELVEAEGKEGASGEFRSPRLDHGLPILNLRNQTHEARHDLVVAQLGEDPVEVPDRSFQRVGLDSPVRHRVDVPDLLDGEPDIFPPLRGRQGGHLSGRCGGR